MPAATLSDVDDFFQNKPINIQQFDELYVNADSGRGMQTYKQLKRRIEKNPDGSLKILFAGHKGCGKTTELVRLQKSIEKDFVILNFSVVKKLDILNIHYIELFIVTMEELFRFFKDEAGLSLDDKLLKNVQNWIQSKEIEEINQKYMGLDVEAQAKSGIKIPFIAEFFAKFSTAAKTSSSIKASLKTHVEPRLPELILNCNLLINEIKNQLPSLKKKGLLIIIEDLDKLDLQKAEDIFYIHSTQLTQLNCHCIFTFPIPLFYNIRYRTIIANYDVPAVLPMIKVFEKDQSECAEGVKVIEDIVKKRMDIALFEDRAILKTMIQKTGGCLWDLFRMIKVAADKALDFDRDKINAKDYTAAYHALKSDYEHTIADNPERKIQVSQYYDVLRSCALDVKKKPDVTEPLLDLMNNLTVLSYNGENWHDVHPIVKDILKEKGKI